MAKFGETTPNEEHLVADLEVALDNASAAWRRNVPRPLLGRATISGLLRQATFDWLVLVLLWSCMAVAPLWLDIAIMPLVAGRLHAFGVILHDATHMPLRGKNWQVRLLEVLVAYPIATTLNAMRYHHLRHHRDSGMASDPYFKAGVHDHTGIWAVQCLRGLFLVPFWTLRAPFGVAAGILPALRPAYARVFLQDRSGATSATLRSSREVRECAREELGQLLFQSVVGIAFVYWPATVAWHYALPVTLTGLLASYRVLCEHNYVKATDRTPETTLATTCDHHMSVWGRLFFAPRNIGFHIVHHLHPQVALQHLPALRAYYCAGLSHYPMPRSFTPRTST